LGWAYRTLAASLGNETAVDVIQEKTDSGSTARPMRGDASNPAFFMFNSDYIGPDVYQLRCRIVLFVAIV
jgi:hypothetical protein